MSGPEPSSRRWAAAGLSLLTPGAGHALRGRLRRGLGWFAVLSLGFLALPWTGPLGFVVAFGGRFVAAPIDAAVCKRGPAAGSVLVSTIVLLGISMVLALGLRTFMVEAFEVPAASMLPTLEIGDKIYANKLATDPAVGDVIVFKQPQTGHDFLKRVVGRGGDRIAVRGGVLYRNGVGVPRGPSRPCGYDDREERTGRWHHAEVECAAESLGGHHYRVVVDPSADPGSHDFPGTDLDGDPWRGFRVGRGEVIGGPADLSADGEYVVPTGHLFVMGDNRDNSYDSRSWGPVPVGNVRATVMYVWWSRGPDGVRWGRLFHRVE